MTHGFLKTGILSILILFLLCSSVIAAPIQITDVPGNQGRPDIRGRYIVWKDLRSGNWDIYAHDLLTSTEIPVSTNVTYENVPVTNGSSAIWQDLRSGANDLFAKGLPLGTPKAIADGPGHQGLPAVDGNLVAYVDDALGDNNIFLADITDPDAVITSAVCTDPASQWQPRISGNIVVWEDSRSGDTDIWMREMPNGAEQPVATGAGNQKVADIDGRNVVWQDDSGGTYSVWMKNLDDNVAVPIATGLPMTMFGPSPRISGDLIVWQSNNDIYGKNLNSGETLTIADGAQAQAYPTVDGEAVVWEEEGGNGYDVWMDYIDVTGPELADLQPQAGGSAVCLSPAISASYSDNRSGIDPASVRLSLDGIDVTAAATIDASSISYDSAGIGAGEHEVVLEVSDVSGNLTTGVWHFTSDSPLLGLFFVDAYWASAANYVNGILSVDYEVTNASASAPSLNTSIVGSWSTSGVSLDSYPPISVGTVGSQSSNGVTVDYSVPFGVEAFRTTLYLESEDSCATPLYHPGPLP